MCVCVCVCVCVVCGVVVVSWALWNIMSLHFILIAPSKKIKKIVFHLLDSFLYETLYMMS